VKTGVVAVYNKDFLPLKTGLMFWRTNWSWKFLEIWVRAEEYLWYLFGVVRIWWFGFGGSMMNVSWICDLY